MPLYLWVALSPPHHHLHLDLPIPGKLTQGNGWKEKQIVAYSYNEMLVSHRKDVHEAQKQNPKGPKHKRMQYRRFHLSGILEKAKLREQKSDQWLSRAGRGEGTGQKRTGRTSGVTKMVCVEMARHCMRLSKSSGQATHLERVNFTVWKLYLNYPDFLKNQKIKNLTQVVLWKAYRDQARLQGSTYHPLNSLSD